MSSSSQGAGCKEAVGFPKQSPGLDLPKSKISQENAALASKMGGRRSRLEGLFQELSEQILSAVRDPECVGSGPLGTPHAAWDLSGDCQHDKSGIAVLTCHWPTWTTSSVSSPPCHAGRLTKVTPNREGHSWK